MHNATMTVVAVLVLVLWYVNDSWVVYLL